MERQGETIIYPHRRLVWLWRLRWAAGFLSLAALSLFVPVPPDYRLWFSVGWGLSFLFIMLVFLPLRHKSLSYRLAGERLIIHSGIIYKSSKILLLQNAEYVTTHTSPDERLLRLCSVSIYTVGGRAALRGLEAGAINNLQLTINK